MTSFKKIISILMAVVMLLGIMSAGMIGIAADFNANEQYYKLAEALKNDYVANLANYNVSNTTLNNGADGFDADANGFAYEHRVTAKDNSAGDILKAANRFYYILEQIMSTEHGIGLYDASMIHSTVTAKLKNFFEGGTEPFYVDFYGERYWPTEEEIAKYENTVSLLEAVDREVTPSTLSSMRIYFIQKDEYTYYNVETIIQYFLGNTLKINAGNWYHKFVFVVETSLDTWLTEAGHITNFADTRINVRKAVYELNYARSYNETESKAYYTFAEPTLTTVWEDYASEFGFENASVDLTLTPITAGGQASALMIKQETDSTTLPHLLSIYAAFEATRNYVSTADQTVNGITIPAGSTWDYYYSKLNETQLGQQPNAADIVGYMDELGSTYSNDALLSLFGKDIGNMISYAYIYKPMSTLPERTVRGEAKYTVTTTKLNSIVTDIDNLVHNPDSDTAERVAAIVSQFFNTNSSFLAGTAVQGLQFDDLKQLVSLIINGMLFTDGIINKLVGMIYPMICKLLEEKLLSAITDAVGSTISGWVGDILTSLLTNNDLAIYPNKLGDQIYDNYQNDAAHMAQFSDAIAILRAAGTSWDNVNMDALHWGVDDATLDKKASAFTDALCAALSGFRLLLVTVMCGDQEYENSNRKSNLSWTSSNQFTEYYDKLLINIGQQGIIMRSQGGYTKLIVPLLRCFGLQELGLNQYNKNNVTGYASPEEYHRLVDADGDNCLRCIVQPIVYWVTEVLASHPFTELWKLLPNLIYFFVRTGTVAIADDWCDGTSNDDSHDNFTTCQTWSLSTIMDHLHLKVTGLGINIYHESIAGFLGDKMDMLRSLNGLLNQFVDLTYIKGKSGVALPCAYTNGTAIVLKDSVEYVTSPGSYPTELYYCYANENETSFTFEKDEDHPVKIENPEYLKVSFKLPQIQEHKITSTTTERADGTLVNPNAIGVLTGYNTIDVRNPGVVLLYVLRFVISSLGYLYDANLGWEDETGEGLPTLIECFLRMNKYEEVEDPQTHEKHVKSALDKELFQGLNLKDIIYNVMLHPDDAICALLELFYSNETGNLYTYAPYTYGLEEINYHNSVLLNKSINPTLTYGVSVKYTKYWTQEYSNATIANSGELIQNVLLMLGKQEFKDGFGAYLSNLLSEKVFNNEIINKLFNVVYKLLGGLNDKVGFDIAAVLDAALNVTYDPVSLGHTLEDILGYATPASLTLIGNENTKWTDVFPTMTETDMFGNETTVVLDADLDWGFSVNEETGQTLHDAHHRTSHDAFLRVLSALLSPAAFVFRYLFMDEHLDLLGLIDLDAYAGYHYAWIGLLEALSCPDILTYREYYARAHASSSITSSKIADANTIYYMLAPLGGLIDKIYEDPITNILNLIPNLMFFISIGGMNDLLNNLVHFAYVLLDIVKPIINGYDLLDGLLANIEIKGYKLNLSLPLDIDFNALISDLLGVLVGDSLNIGGMQLTLPYIDFHTLCCGKLAAYNSREERSTVRLDSAEGADLLTALLRLVFDVLFMEENKEAVANLVVDKVGVDEEGNPKLDAYDKRTLLQIIDQLYAMMEEHDVPDMLLFVVYQLVTKLTPLSGSLAQSLSASGMTVTDLFSNISDPKSFLQSLAAIIRNMGITGTVDPDGTISNPAAAGNLLSNLRAFFQRILDFFRNLFGIKPKEAATP